MTESKQDRIQRVARIVDPRAWETQVWGGWRYRDALDRQAEILSKASAIEAIYEGIGKDQERAQSQPSGLEASPRSSGLDAERAAVYRAALDKIANPLPDDAMGAARHIAQAALRAGDL